MISALYISKLTLAFAIPESGMSQVTVSSESDATITAELVDTFTVYSTIALVTYEYILTARQEVTMIWQRKWTLVTWLFIANRYIMVVETILAITAIYNKRPYSLLVRYLAHIVVTLTAFQPALFSIASIQVLLALYLILNIYGIVTIGTRIPVIIADILVLALTWHKTFRHRMDAIRVGVRTPLSALLLRDGTVYFFALLAMNIAVILVNTVPPLQTASPISDIIPALTPILISRFLLNLRQLGETDAETQSSFNSQFSIAGFRIPASTSLVETMGADLQDHDTAEEVDDEAEDVGVSSRNKTSMSGPAEP
ncbi:hypothetical protein EW026_g2162 [Hermanssonia centrifuga]|uniref:DUF6533 domain-containing protein n=1 Tax=Hermanssonia centrifuga TaxID=98765 RepID=A0A4S4KP31_9APHY|nr:hypothetical protein EW026_g2162 [Hermanssonia centrifuga]